MQPIRDWREWHQTIFHNSWEQFEAETHCCSGGSKGNRSSPVIKSSTKSQLSGNRFWQQWFGFEKLQWRIAGSTLHVVTTQHFQKTAHFQAIGWLLLHKSYVETPPWPLLLNQDGSESGHQLLYGGMATVSSLLQRPSWLSGGTMDDRNTEYYWRQYWIGKKYCN